MRLEYNADRFEVVIVDDGSIEPVVKPFCDQLNLKLLRTVNSGPAAARNKGAAVSEGEYLVFTDDDCRPAIDWMKKIDDRLQHSPDHLIGGRTINDLPDNSYSTTSHIILEVVYSFYNRIPGAPRFFASNNMAVSSELFHEIGGFNSHLRTAEDRDLCNRWLKAGLKMSYEPTAVIFHAHLLTFRFFCRQHFNYGRGAAHFHRLRILRGTTGVTSDIKFHARLPSLLRKPISKLPERQVAVVSGMLFLWQILNAAGFFYELLRTNTMWADEFSDQQKHT